MTYPGIDESEPTDNTPPGWVRLLAWNDMSVEAPAGADPFATNLVLLDADRWATGFDSLADLFSQEGLVLALGDEIHLVGPLESLANGDWPFPDDTVRIDPMSWAYTRQSLTGHGGDWSVSVNGWTLFVDLQSFPVAGAIADLSNIGELLELTAGDVDAGCRLGVDAFGCAWVSVWELSDYFIGFDSFDGPVELLNLGTGDFEIGYTGLISTSLLDREQLRAAIRQLNEVSWADLSDAEVSFEGEVTPVGDWLT